MSIPPNEPPRYVTCPCQHCSGHIEFDASGFAKDETRAAECPHCNLETIIFVPVATSQDPKPIANTIPNTSTTKQSSSQVELFYYKIADRENGPYTFDQLRSLWNSGQITGDALFRNEKSSQWEPLSVRIGQQSRISFAPITKLNSLLLKCIFAISLVAFFLPNASVSVPIFGKIEVSMFDFFTPKSDKPTVEGEKPAKPNIKDVIDSDDFQLKKVNFGAIICALAVLGIVLHYLLTIVWGVLSFAFKKTFSILNIVWLALALQFPILFSIGAHIAIGAIKAKAMSDAGNDGDNSPGAALGTALGAAFINQISMQPGAIMWVLMVIALFCLGLPFLARQFKPVS
jgi:hypothetical protein